MDGKEIVDGLKAIAARLESGETVNDIVSEVVNVNALYSEGDESDYEEWLKESQEARTATEGR